MVSPRDRTSTQQCPRAEKNLERGPKPKIGGSVSPQPRTLDRGVDVRRKQREKKQEQEPPHDRTWPEKEPPREAHFGHTGRVDRGPPPRCPRRQHRHQGIVIDEVRQRGNEQHDRERNASGQGPVPAASDVNTGQSEGEEKNDEGCHAISVTTAASFRLYRAAAAGHAVLDAPAKAATSAFSMGGFHTNEWATLAGRCTVPT